MVVVGGCQCMQFLLPNPEHHWLFVCRVGWMLGCLVGISGGHQTLGGTQLPPHPYPRPTLIIGLRGCWTRRRMCVHGYACNQRHSRLDSRGAGGGGQGSKLWRCPNWSGTVCVTATGCVELTAVVTCAIACCKPACHCHCCCHLGISFSRAEVCVFLGGGGAIPLQRGGC